MKKRNKLLLFGSSLLLALGIGISVQNMNAVTFYDCIGRGTYKIFYNVKDYKNITASSGYTAGEKANALGLYSGITEARVCIDCDDELNQNKDDANILWENVRVYNKNAQQGENKYPKVTQYREGSDMVYINATIPETTKNGLHYACVQVKDTAGNYSNSNRIANCHKFYYDIEGPTFKSSGITINDNKAYSNTGENIPVSLIFYDNYAGLKSLSYNNGFPDDETTDEDESITTIDLDNLPSGSKFLKRRDTNGKWTYSLKTTLTLNSDISEIDVVFTGTDRVKNVGKSKAVSLRFDKKAPDGVAEIVTKGDGNTIDSNIVSVDLNLIDSPTTNNKYPSGFKYIDIMEEDGSNKQSIFTDTNLTKKDGTNTLEERLTNYVLSSCDSGPKRLVISMTDRAGNTNTIYTNEVICSTARISRYDVDDVENPGSYPSGFPSDPLSWIFKDNDETEHMEELAKLLAGGNYEFSFDVEWDGSSNATATALYQMFIVPEGCRTESCMIKGPEKRVYGTGFIDVGNDKKISSFNNIEDTIPANAPTGADVMVKITATITTSDGGGITRGTAVFDKNGNMAHWGTIVGSIDDYLQFSEIN